MSDAGMAASASACVVEQLLAESEALLASIDGTPSSVSISSSGSFPSASACSSPGGTPTPSAVHTGQPGVKTKRHRNSTRDRMHCELQFLRRHVSELEVELDEKKMLVVCDGSGDSTRRMSFGQTRSVSAWENVAQRQKRARTLCEKENQSLQSRVKEQAELIRTIRELLLAHRQRSAQWRQSYASHLDNRMLATGWEEAADFTRLKRDAVIAFAQSNRVLTVDNGTGVLAISANEGNVVSHDYDKQKQCFVSRLTSTRLFPFDIHAASNATWRAVNSIYKNMLRKGAADTTGSIASSDHVSIAAQSDFHVVERSDDTYAVQYTVTLDIGGGVALTVRVKDVVTRFASDNTTPGESVFIWQTALDTSSSFGRISSVGEPSGQGPSRIRGTGWIAFHKQPWACSSSVMRSVFEFHIEKQEAAGGDGGDNTDNREVELMKSWMTLGEACVDTISLEIDKILL